MSYNYYGYNTSSYSDVATASAMSSIMIVYMLFAIAIAVVQIIAMWKIFTKAGEAGWKSIVPVYNLITLYKIIGLSPWLLFVYLASFIPFVGSIAILVLNIFQNIYLSKSFGKSGGFTVGLIFLTPIFYMILGFGKDEYVGPNGSPATINTNND